MFARNTIRSVACAALVVFALYDVPVRADNTTLITAPTTTQHSIGYYIASGYRFEWSNKVSGPGQYGRWDAVVNTNTGETAWDRFVSNFNTKFPNATLTRTGETLSIDWGSHGKRKVTMYYTNGSGPPPTVTGNDDSIIETTVTLLADMAWEFSLIVAAVVMAIATFRATRLVWSGSFRWFKVLDVWKR